MASPVNKVWIGTRWSCVSRGVQMCGTRLKKKKKKKKRLASERDRRCVAGRCAKVGVGC